MGRKNQPFLGTVDGHGSAGKATHGRRFPIRLTDGRDHPVTVKRINRRQLDDLRKHVQDFKDGKRPEDRTAAIIGLR